MSWFKRRDPWKGHAPYCQAVNYLTRSINRAMRSVEPSWRDYYLPERCECGGGQR